MTARGYALTDDQIEDLANRIAARIASEHSLRHYRQSLASVVEEELSGTPYLGAAREGGEP